MKIASPVSATFIGLGLSAIPQLPTSHGAFSENDRCRYGQELPVESDSTEVLERLIPDIWPQTMEFIASRNLSFINYNSCTYAVVTVGEVCDSKNATDCFRVASYGGEECAAVTPCASPNSGLIPIPFAANCSGISADFPDCQLVCYDDATEKAGYDTCVAGAPTSAPFPTPTSAGWSRARTGLGGAVGACLAFLSLL